MMAIAIVALSVTIYDIFAIEMLIPYDPDIYSGIRSNVNMPTESHWKTSHLMTIIMSAIYVMSIQYFLYDGNKMSAISVPIYKIFTNEIK